VRTEHERLAAAQTELTGLRGQLTSLQQRIEPG
jgi:hypothetical protein